MRELSPADLGWVAGLLEGEGAFMVLRRGARLSCNMTDGDVIRRLQAVTGVGNISGPHSYEGREWKPVYRWNLNRRAEVTWLCSLLRPLMGERRTAAIDKVLAHLDDTARVLRDHGTPACYQRGCRCTPCRAANTARHRQYRNNNRVDGAGYFETVNMIHERRDATILSVS